MDTSASPQSPTTAAIIVAAGKGLRAGQPLPKQFAAWRGCPVMRHSVETLLEAGCFPIVVVIPSGADAIAQEALMGLGPILYVTGGANRQDSVRIGLEAIQSYAPDSVLIHDAARPHIPVSVLERLAGALRDHAAAIPVLPVADSLIFTCDTSSQLMMAQAAPRDQMRRVQTPQAFHYSKILAAHQNWQGPTLAGDDAQVAQSLGIDIALVDGDEALHKLTYANDFNAEPSTLPLIRMGTGYDVHALTEGEDLWLCGVKVEHTHGLAGHSDADVAIHALVDALLGAIAAGDIGQHFPPSDEKWRGASSDQFLIYAHELVQKSGYQIANVDVSIICEAPKIGPHREAMRERLAAILGIDTGLVSVKATTTEKLGFTGRREGIASQAIAALIRA